MPPVHVCPCAHPWTPASAVAGRHSTQRLAPPRPPRTVQYGVGTPPSAPPVLPLQSASDTQATQEFLDVSQMGAMAVVHCVLSVQPARHVPLPPQTGVVPPQSAFEAHCTQTLFRQKGVAPEQLAFDSHWTQVCVIESQTLRAVGQLADVTQPTQAPDAVSQRRALAH